MKKNKILSSKLEFVLKENDFLKNKISLISKELDLVSEEKVSLKNNFDSHVCHTTIDSSSIDTYVAYSTSSSIIENDICILNVDCLSSEPLCHERQEIRIHIS